MLALPSDFFSINIGNVITWATLLGCVFAAWQKIKDRLDHHERRMEHVEKELDILSSKGVPTLCQLHTERLLRIEAQLGVLTTVATDVSWIKATLQKNGHNERKDK